MIRSLRIVAGLLIVSGSIFVGQGLGILRGNSFMVDDIRWTWIGAGLVAVGLAIAALSLRAARRGRG